MVKLAPQLPAGVSTCSLGDMAEGSHKIGKEGERHGDADETQGIGMTPSVALIVAVGTLGSSLPTGYNLGVVNMPQEVLKSFVNATRMEQGVLMSAEGLESTWSVVVSALLGGAIFGSLCAGYLANKISRRGALFANCLVGVVSSVLFAVSHTTFSTEVLITARLLAGFCGGLGSSVAPMYLMETAPPNLRGAFGVMQQLGLTTGVLLSQVLGLKEFLGTRDLWPVLLSLYGVGMLFGLVAILFCPSSPSFLYINQRREELAFRELERLRGVPVQYLSQEILLLRKERKLTEMSSDWSLGKIFRSKQTRTALFLVCCLHAAQQLSGISAVFYYSTSTFARAGMNEEQTQYGSIGAGVANALMACLAVPLVNRVRRRTLLIVSFSGSICCLIALTVSMATQHLVVGLPFLSITLVLAFVLIYGVGLGPLPFMLGSELLAQGPRAAVMGLGCVVNWSANFFVAIVFPYLQSCLGEYVFLGFAAVTTILFPLIWLYLPETKDLDPTQVASILQGDSPEDLDLPELDSRDLVTDV